MESVYASRQTALAAGVRHFFSGHACKNGHVSERLSSSGICVECNREICAARYALNPDKYLAEQRRKRRNNQAAHARKKAIWRASPQARAHEMLVAARRRAAIKGRPFDLTVEWIAHRINAGICELTGLPFNFEPATGRRQNPFAPSLDRRDSNGGYTMDNTRLVVWSINCALSDTGEAVFAKIAKAYLDRAGLT